MRGPSALTITVFVLPAASSAGGSVAAAAAAPLTLTAVETVGRNVAAFAVDTNPFSATRTAKPASTQARPMRHEHASSHHHSGSPAPSARSQGGATPAVAAMQEGGATPGVPAPPLERWTLFRINLGELGASSWERINWKNDAISPNAEFYIDEVRLVRFAPQPPAEPVQQALQPVVPSPQPPPAAAPPTPRAEPSPSSSPSPVPVPVPSPTPTVTPTPTPTQAPVRDLTSPMPLASVLTAPPATAGIAAAAARGSGAGCSACAADVDADG